MNRSIELLKKLENSNYVISEDLALTFNVSTRTIRNDFKELEKQALQNGFEIESRPRYGYRLIIHNQEKYNKFINENANTEFPISLQNRSAFIVNELITENKYITVEHLANKYYISKTTMLTILKQCDNICKEFNLKIDRKNSKGVNVVGTEYDKRRCISHLLAHYDINKYYYPNTNIPEIRKISKKIYEIIQKYNINLSEIGFHIFLSFVFIDVERIKKGYNLEYEFNFSEDIEEMNVINEMSLYIEKYFNLNLNVSERKLLAYKLAGLRSSSDFDLGNANLYINEDIHKLAIDMIELAYVESGFDFRNDFDLQLNLMRHLVPMLIRLRCGIDSLNELKDMIKNQYSFGYSVAKKSSKIIENKYKVHVSDDEISYLALIFSLSLEKEKRYSHQNEKKNIALVCGSSTGSAHLLMYKYQNEFKDDLNQIEIYSVNDIDKIDCRKIDYIFTTVPISKHLPVPIVQVGYFLDKKDKDKIKNIFQQKKENILSSYYKEDQFIPHLKAINKNEVLQQMFDFAKDKYGLTKKYFESVITRELLAKTAFGNLVAMPHAVETLCDECFVYVAVLDKPIMWDDQKVQVVFLVNVGKKRGQELVKFYELTTRFMMDLKLIEQLIENPNFDYFINILHHLNELS